MVVFKCIRVFLFVALIFSVVQPGYSQENDLDKAKALSHQVIKLYNQWSPLIVAAMKEDDHFKEELRALLEEVIALMQ